MGHNVKLRGARILARPSRMMGWTPRFCWRTLCAAVFHLAWRSAPINSEGESKMHATTVAVDLAKNVFQLAIADASWKVIESHRLTRTQFERWFAKRDVGLVIMEACGSAHQVRFRSRRV